MCEVDSSLRLAARGRGRREVDWPSACTPLKALCKVAPARVHGRLPVMHEVTRRVVYGPALSKATVSECQNEWWLLKSPRISRKASLVQSRPHSDHG